ncbi:HD domain-containing protein [bacterium]|nr:HD domain-containing protein [bacterium]
MKLWTKIWQTRYSILFQILLFMLIAALIPLLVSNSIFFGDSENMIGTHVHEINSVLAENSAQWINNFNNSIKNYLETLSEIQTNPNFSPELKDSLSGIIVAQNNNIDVVWIRFENLQTRLYDNSKQVLTQNDQLSVLVRDQGLYQRVLAGQVYISDPFLRRYESNRGQNNSLPDNVIITNQNAPVIETLIHYVLPLWDRGQPVGVLYAEINITPIRNHIATVSPSKTGPETFIIDRSGRVIAHTDERIALELKDFSQSPIVKKIKEMQTIFQADQQEITASFSLKSDNDRDMLANIKLIDEINWERFTGETGLLAWSIVAQEPREIAFFPLFETTKKLRRYGAIAIILAITLAGFLAFHLTRPVLTLTRAAEQFAAGNHAINVQVSTKNEIGLLASAFNNMTTQIRNYLAELEQRAHDIRDLFFSSMETIVAAIDARDPYTRGHSLRVTRLSLDLGTRVGLAPKQLEELRIAAMLHDVGKIGIRDSVLLKTSKLTDEEYEIMKTHPVLGATIMGPIKMMKEIIPGMKYHHEWWNGSGYPNGIKAMEIPLYARIIAIADTFDAMTSDRPYQQRMDPTLVLVKIQEWAGTRYDPDLVNAFVQVFNEQHYAEKYSENQISPIAQEEYEQQPTTR